MMSAMRAIVGMSPAPPSQLLCSSSYTFLPMAKYVVYVGLEPKCPWRKRNHEGAAGALWCGLSEFFDISGYDLKKIVEYLGASVCKVIFSNVFHILL